MFIHIQSRYFQIQEMSDVIMKQVYLAGSASCGDAKRAPVA